MSTSVKHNRADKVKLDKLQALVTLKSGGKITQITGDEGGAGASATKG